MKRLSLLAAALLAAGASPIAAGGQTVATAPGPAAMLASGYATRFPIPLGREFQVTGAMVTYHAPASALYRHHSELELRGAAGDRFLISWRSPTPLEFSYERRRTIDAYPDRAPANARSFSTTIVFSRDAVERISFVQLGVAEDGAQRAFLPWFVTVQKLG